MINQERFLTVLIMLFDSKSKTYTESMLNTWYTLLKDFDENKVFKAIKELMYSSEEFINVGKIISLMGVGDNAKIEQEWKECLVSAKFGGQKPISARSAKALNSFGGMSWLRDADPEKTEWQKKEFIQAYLNTPEPIDTDFRCLGQTGNIYLTDQKLLGE